jgi:hypothetical protein
MANWQHRSGNSEYGSKIMTSLCFLTTESLDGRELEKLPEVNGDSRLKKISKYRWQRDVMYIILFFMISVFNIGKKERGKSIKISFRYAAKPDIHKIEMCGRKSGKMIKQCYLLRSSDRAAKWPTR